MKNIIIKFLLIILTPCIAFASTMIEGRAVEINQFLTDQFKSFKHKSITKEGLDKFEKTLSNTPYCRYQIIDQKLHYKCHITEKLSCHEYLTKLIAKYKVPNVDFILLADDRFPGVENKEENEFAINFPAFMMSKDLNDENEKNFLLMPDLYMMRHWPKEIKRVSSQVRRNYWQENGNWHSKENKVYWRGATSGPLPYTVQNFDKLPRIKLVMFSSLYPGLIDAKFVNVTGSKKMINFNEEMTNFISWLQQGEQKAVKPPKHLPYKYLISIEGRTAAWLRIPWILISDSILIKQEASTQEWFYPALVPYVHYVPVKEDLSDLFQQIEWLKKNDDTARQISNNATKFIHDNLMPEHIEQHMVLILNEYAKLQSFSLTEPSI